LREHLSGIIEKVLASLLVAALLYALTFVPKVGPTLSMTIAIPVWLLVSVPLAAGLLTLLFRRTAANRRASQALSFDKIVKRLDRETPAKIGEIRFDYLPDTPASHGWTIGLDQGALEPPSFVAVPDAPVPGSIAIHSRGTYYMDYAVDPHAAFSDRVDVTVRYSKDAMVYAKIRVETRDGAKSKTVWLAEKIGNSRDKQFNESEWEFSSPGAFLDGGWVALALPLSGQITTSFGRQGWVFDRLIGFRVRGSLGLSPLTLYKSNAL
jgi:hypothetical protein